VIHGTGCGDDRVDVGPCEEFGIAGRGDSEPPPHLLGAPLTGRGDGDQVGSGKPLSVLGMEPSHPAKTGDAEPKRTRRP